MNFCKDCKHYKRIEIEVEFYNQIHYSEGYIQKKIICTRQEGVKYDPVHGSISNIKGLITCKELRNEYPSPEYPRCGYEGKWFEGKEK